MFFGHISSLFIYFLGVYTKNRNFRLFLSSKLGKKNNLVVASQNEYRRNDVSQSVNLEDIFHDSMVSNVEYVIYTYLLVFSNKNYF